MSANFSDDDLLKMTVDIVKEFASCDHAHESNLDLALEKVYDKLAELNKK